MPVSPSISPARGRRPRRGASAPIAEPESRFDRRLGEILGHATDVFCEKGYEGASMRDLSRASGMSLAGLYHYFGSKERLLYLIQKHTFTTIVEKLKSRLETVGDPEQRIRLFIQNHLEYFVANQSGLKVLSHEDEALKNEYGAELAALKRQYYRLCVGLMDDLKRDRSLEFDSRTAVMSLFGMINWIYTWYNPRVDGTAEDLARQMGDVFLNGVSGKIATRQARPGETSLGPHLQSKDKEKDVKGHAVRRA
jgi:AcrR family transcriptional regulator